MKQKILVVEDDQSIATGLVDLLENEGYKVYYAPDGKKAIDLYEENNPDLILLDIMIPEMSGYDVCKKIRQKDQKVPILMLTAKGQEIDKVIGLENGADDYIVKPFGIHELLARIRTNLRRMNADAVEMNLDKIEFGDIVIEPDKLIGKKGNKEFAVTTREVKLLQFFIQNEGKVMDRDVLLENIWGVRYEGTTRTLDQHIAKLRQKIEEDPANPVYIKTIYTVGYQFSKN